MGAISTVVGTTDLIVNKDYEDLTGDQQGAAALYNVLDGAAHFAQAYGTPNVRQGVGFVRTVIGGVEVVGGVVSEDGSLFTKGALDMSFGIGSMVAKTPNGLANNKFFNQAGMWTDVVHTVGIGLSSSRQPSISEPPPPPAPPILKPQFADEEINGD